MKKSYVYDIEVYPNYFCASFIDTKTPQELIDKFIEYDHTHNYKWSIQDNDAYHQLISNGYLKTFVQFGNQTDIGALLAFLNKEVEFLVGFNNLSYDDLVIVWLFLNFTRTKTKDLNSSLYQVSKHIVLSQDRYNDDFIRMLTNYGTPFTPIDTFQIAFNTIERKSLKQTAINLKWYKIQDLPYPPEFEVTDKEAESILIYNLNDALITQLLYHKLREPIILRLGINNKYNCSHWENVLNKSKSGIADVMLAKFYSKASGLDYKDFKDQRTFRNTIKFADCISTKIKFTTPEFRDLYDRLMKTEITGTKGSFSEVLEFGNHEYKLGTGGLHSKDTHLYLESSDILIIRDADVTSYYPFITINEKIKPAHLRPAFFDCTIQIINDRVEAKRNKDKVAAETLKITVNSGGFGKMGYPNHWVYDPQAMISVTINGQLYLLMLIEALTVAGFDVISANTDGIVTIFHPNREEEYNKICNKWMKYTKFNLEYKDYTKYIRADVNNYATESISWDGDTMITDYKEKGAFVRDIEIQKGYDKPIIAIALHNLFFKGISVEETIYNHTNIYDFCSSQKVNSTFNTLFRYVENGEYHDIKLQKNNRFYVCVGHSTYFPTGYIYKDYKEPKYSKSVVKGKTKVTKRQASSVVKGQRVALFNNYLAFNDFRDYQIDYRYYITKTNEIVNQILNTNNYDLFNLQS